MSCTQLYYYSICYAVMCGIRVVSYHNPNRTLFFDKNGISHLHKPLPAP